jgi:tRNA(Ile)-lysidine synthase
MSQLIRPLLHFKRETLLDYAKQNKLEWFEDPSNQSLQFNRNYIRHKVTPIIQERWPIYQYSIATVCNIQAETQQLLDDLAAIDYATVSVSSDNSALAKLVPTLNKDALGSLSLARQKNVLRYWLRINERENLPKARLESFIQQLGAKQSANPMIQNSSYDIRIYDSRVFIVDREIAEPQQEAYDFLNHLELYIPELNLVLRRNVVLDYLGLEDSGQMIQIRFRNNQLTTNQSSHRLKRLFQAQKIAPWLRNTTPQLYIDGELRGLWVV